MKKRLLGIDFGKKHTGLAVADYPGLTAKPLATLRYDSPRFWIELERIIADENINAFLVGYPESEVHGEIHDSVERFIRELKDHFPLFDIETLDESYTSIEADIMLHETGQFKKGKRTGQHSQAAKILLLRYLNKNSS